VPFVALNVYHCNNSAFVRADDRDGRKRLSGVSADNHSVKDTAVGEASPRSLPTFLLIFPETCLPF